MADFIKTRNPLQCRSHHQKLTLKFHYANRIINHYKSHNDLSLYNQFFSELESDQNRKE